MTSGNNYQVNDVKMLSKRRNLSALIFLVLNRYSEKKELSN